MDATTNSVRMTSGSIIPAAALAVCTPFAVHDAAKAAVALTGIVLVNATIAVSLYVRAINVHGAAPVAMLFAVIPAAAAVLSWLMLGQRPDVGVAIGLFVGGLACWLNSRTSGRGAPAEQSRPLPERAAVG